MAAVAQPVQSVLDGGAAQLGQLLDFDDHLSFVLFVVHYQGLALDVFSALPVLEPGQS